MNNLGVFYNLELCDLDWAYSQLKESEISPWNNRRYTKSKLRYYNMYEFDHSQEDYLNLNINKYQRSIFAQFRAGILPLQVEIGRYRNAPLSERKCLICSKNEVKDELHLLCICDKYKGLRSALFIKASNICGGFNELDDLEKLVFIMNNIQNDAIKF